jgi:hypothetical protein
VEVGLILSRRFQGSSFLNFLLCFRGGFLDHTWNVFDEIHVRLQDLL